VLCVVACVGFFFCGGWCVAPGVAFFFFLFFFGVFVVFCPLWFGVFLFGGVLFGFVFCFLGGGCFCFFFLAGVVFFGFFVPASDAPTSHDPSNK